jgi:hypothetical protein
MNYVEDAFNAFFTVLWWWFWYGLVASILGNASGFILVFAFSFAYKASSRWLLSKKGTQ